MLANMNLRIQNHIMSEQLSSQQLEDAFLARQRQSSEFRKQISEEVALKVAEELGGVALRNRIESQVDFASTPPITATRILVSIYPELNSIYLGYRRLVAAYGEQAAEDFLPGITDSANAWLQEFEENRK